MSDHDRHRDQSDYGRRRDFDDYRQETAGRSGEGRSWRGDSGRDFEPQQVGARGYQTQGYGAQDRDYRDNARYGQNASYSESYREQGYGRGGQDFGRGYDQGGYDQGRGYGASNRGGWSFERHGYAPGAEIWGERDSGRSQSRSDHHDFEPDYLHWREQQLNSFDNDYRNWRDERRTRFTNDFDTWRKSRSDNVKAEAANPYVGDVSEGGVGRVATKGDDRNKQ